MPGAVAVQIDWAGIRANAVSMGIRAAARAAAVNLPDIERERFVKRVLKRAEREQWVKAKQAAMSSAVVINEKPLSSNVVSGSDSIAKVLADDSNATKTGFSRMARRVAEAAAGYKVPKALENSRALRDVATIAGQVHGWDAKRGSDAPALVNINILAQ